MRSGWRRPARALALAALGLGLASSAASAGSYYPENAQFEEWLHSRPSTRATYNVAVAPTTYTYTYFTYGGQTYRAYPVVMRPATVAPSTGFRLFPRVRR